MNNEAELNDPDIASENDILKCEKCDWVLREGNFLRSHKTIYHECDRDLCDFIANTEIDHI